jgi:hypothetical protein
MRGKGVVVSPFYLRDKQAGDLVKKPYPRSSHIKGSRLLRMRWEMKAQEAPPDRCLYKGVGYFCWICLSTAFSMGIAS